MGKSILVMDTPECCEECPFCKGLNDCKVMKYLNGDKITTIYTVDKQIFDGTKPDWCPLQDAPEKKSIDGLRGRPLLEAQFVGWNECIDRILNGG